MTTTNDTLTIETTTLGETTTITTTTTQPETDDDSSTWIILLATLLPISLIISGLIGLYFYKKYFDIRHAKPISRQSSHMTDTDRGPNPIAIMDYSSEVDRRLKIGDLAEEFTYINEYSSEINILKTRTIGNDENNKNRNRFIDIIPFDENVILLESSPGGSPYSKYINASLIKGLSISNKNYIASQGPKRNTVIDFWNMIVEYDVNIIVCLTNITENNRIKCFQYWPDVGENLNFDDLTISTLRERYNRSTQEVIVRDMSILLEIPDKGEKKAHFVTQIHLTSWPDHGVPETTFPLLETSRIVRYIQKNLEIESFDREKVNSSPICIHCSAGVGRTGTFLAVHMICEQILDDNLREIDVLSTVKHLREQRQKMVQSLSQYILVYQAIKDFINMKYQFNNSKNEEILSDYRVQKDETCFVNQGFIE